MEDNEDPRVQDGAPSDETPIRVNPGYASFQLAKALTTSVEHQDPETRERAKERISKWKTVLQNILTAAVDYGSRTPVKDTPPWATLEVITGGFATGRLLAGGPLQWHEQEFLSSLPRVSKGAERQALNAYFLTDAGLAELQERLNTGYYEVIVPEEGALLVVAWLAGRGLTEEARSLINELSPYFDELRFFPRPGQQPGEVSSKVHLKDVASTIRDLEYVEPNLRVLAQKENIEVWAPWYDRMVALFLETVVDGWPCQQYPNNWPDRALALLGEYAELRKLHKLCGKSERRQGHFAQLREFLGRCATKPTSLKGREVGRIRLILRQYEEKRGAPGSPECTEARNRQASYVSGPTFHAITQAVLPRFAPYPGATGVDNVDPLQKPITREESVTFDIPEATSIPVSIRRKIGRCLNATIQVLIERDLITSGETLARVLPQMISGMRAGSISDPAARQLYAAIYRAFRRRRSLLLLDLEKQVQIEELPWVAAIERFRTENVSSRDFLRQELEEISALTLSSFPHAILPNKLLQELRALVKGAGLDAPLVDEVAADIFMGEFAPKFLESAKRAASLMEGSLYATYYSIDYEEVKRIPQLKKPVERSGLFGRRQPLDPFVEFCAARAGITYGSWDAAINGMIIEQQQILTTQNLAALFSALDLTNTLQDQLRKMAEHCFAWICDRQQVKISKWHAGLIMVKNTAYAWRQMIFFLSMLPEPEVNDFLSWAMSRFEEERESFRNRFRPAMHGLQLAAQGRPIDDKSEDARRFLGWSKASHWLLVDHVGS